nr:hypothetical protein [uncultured Methanoregula sp.]
MENKSVTIRKYGRPVLFGLIILAIGMLGILTGQWAIGLVLIIITAVFFLAFNYLDTHGPETMTGNQNAWVMLAAGVIVGATATALATWVAWAVAFSVLFLILYVLTRIEQRLGMLEYRSTRRILRRRTRGGAGPRHRA